MINHNQMQQDDRLSKRTFEMIEQELSLYHDTKKRIELRREEILNPHVETDTNTGGGKSNVTSDPTYRKASSLQVDIRLTEMVRITNAIERVWMDLTDEKKQLVKLYYWTKPKTLTLEGVALKLHITSRTVKRWRTEIIKAIAMFLGWR